MNSLSSLKPAETARLRSALRSSIRNFFIENGYLEVETPTLVDCPGAEVHLDYFATNWIDHSQKSHRRYLRSSPELHMKQLMAEGLPAVFQLAPAFRNHGEHSEWHHPEFLMLEWYKRQGFEDLIAETTGLLRQTHSDLQRAYPKFVTFTFPDSIERLSISEAFRQFAGIDLHDQDPDLWRRAKEQNIRSLQKHDDFETAFFKIILERIEPALAAFPITLLTDYPESMASLAHVKNGWAQRVEVYVGSVELSNGFEELTGAVANRRRITQINSEREKTGRTSIFPREEFFAAMDELPDCAGNALGFDRWLALLLGQCGIGPLIPFRSHW